MEPFLAQMIFFGANFAPRNWALCDGQILAINQNQSLYSLLGTTYGGDGRTTFALPDARGRVIIQSGQGAGLSDFNLGARGGQQTVTLSTNNLPAHGHSGTVQLAAAIGTSAVGTNNNLAFNAVADTIYTTTAPGTATLGTNAVKSQPTGGNQPIDNRSPYQGINLIIALSGTFPSRN